MNPADPLDPKAILRRYLRQSQEALLWKLEGASEYDARRPLTPTGTNLLGLVKHVAGVTLGYVGACFGRDPGIAMPHGFEDDAEPNADMWATADESRASIVEIYRSAMDAADATIAELDLDAPGRVPWWGDRGDVTLQQIVVHLIAETNRHAGHADIVRELIDGSAGLRSDNDNLGLQDETAWRSFHERVEQAAQTFRAP